MGGGSIWALIKKRNPEAIAVLNEMERKAEDDSKIKKAKMKKLEGSKSKKISKDDSAVLEMKAKKSKEEFMKDVEIKPRAKDDIDLLSMARNLQSVNVEKLEENEIYEHVGNLKKFLKSAMNKLKDNSLVEPTKNIFQALDKMPEDVDFKNTEVPQDMANQLLTAIEQIKKLKKRGVNEWGKEAVEQK